MLRNCKPIEEPIHAIKKRECLSKAIFFTNIFFLDIDECTQDPPVCLAGTKCINVHATYKCIPVKPHISSSVEKGQCPVGFFRNLVNHACDGKFSKSSGSLTIVCISVV